MTIRTFGIIFFVGCGLAILLAAAPLSTSKIVKMRTPIEELAPHRATYQIQMVSRETGSQVLNVSGDMSYEWKPDCDAWTTNHTFRLYYEYTDSMPLNVVSHFTTYETFDGDLFSFNVKRSRNGQVFEELRGQAQKEKDGAGQALYTKPAGLSFDLPQETLFPTAHTIEMVQDMHAGKKFFNAVVFDGSDDEGPVEINSFIGKPVNALEEVPLNDKIDNSLIETPAQQVRMAFFPYFEDSAESEYEMDAILHDNGIISKMKVEYKDFAVTQTLTNLEEIHPDLSCGDHMKL